ncbi:diguanylate cyclase [Caballeronia arationis]|jgi:diguanylate cyclase (GGDEF)-like protein|uniref:diguanylate cyclase n=1 Tax=Caballeronia arationis TaxID=1777142 RepID=A0A7Z7N2Z6_9BURK|nr:GGDEF domain-containing protein [Caballeronia arationis]SAK41824.1 diguanylate cyclase [Caballeronia arationis]SOE80215.1 diguanylate cyclase (GGDEF) domain-containing protein [Caballeronia arationis]
MFSPVSILVVTALSSILSILVLISLLPNAIAGVPRWICANMLALFSIVLFAMQGALPPVFGILLANQLLAATVLLIFEGCNQFFDSGARQARSNVGWFAWLAVLAGIAYFTYKAPDVNVRVVIVSAFHAACDLAIMARVLISRPRERPRYNYFFAAGAAGLGGIGHLVRGLIYVVAPPSQTALLQPGAMQIAFLALGILVLPSLSIGLVMMAHDRLAQRLERLARFDDLTGTLSRKAFLELAAARLARPAQDGTREYVAVVDIDHFKSVNDRYGHAAGDEVLRHFAGLVAARIGEAGFGRIGGEEFCLIRAARNRGEFAALVEMLRQTVESTPCPLPGVMLRYTFSAGIACRDGSESLATLLARADARLYAAKVGGRNRVESEVASVAA